MTSESLPTVEAEFQRFMLFLAASVPACIPMVGHPLTYDEVDAIDGWLCQMRREQNRVFAAIGRRQYPGT